MTEQSHAQEKDGVPRTATVMLVSGELDKALLAFEIAAGMQAMGTQVSMWFVLYGINCLKRPRGRFSLSRLIPRRLPGGAGRKPDSDTPLQHVLGALNHDGAPNLPLSQLNYLGAGPWLLKRIMNKKGMASLAELIESAQRLGVRFTICQLCVDAMGCDIESDLVVQARVQGVSRYTLEVQDSQYNVVF